MNQIRAISGAPGTSSGSDSKRLTVCYPMAGDVFGGSHMSLRGLLEGLDPAEVRVLVALERPHGRLAEHYDGFEQQADPAPPVRPFEAGEQFRFLDMLRALRGVRKRAHFLKENGVDIVHTNDGRSHATWAFAAKLAGAKLVWHHRGNPTARGLRFVAPWIADRILTVSAFALPRAKLGAASRAMIVRSPFDVTITVDRSAARARIIEELGLPDDAILCAYVGNFIERKRPLAFVDAVVALQRMTGRTVRGLLFGEALDSKSQDALSEKVDQSEGCAVLMGFRAPGYEWLGGCDLLLVPAVEEPLGRTLVEAMLVGTPVVATTSGGNSEALADGCGVLVEDFKAETMACAALKLLEDEPRRKKMTSHASQSARERFSRERHVNLMMEVYRDLTDGAEQSLRT